MGDTRGSKQEPKIIFLAEDDQDDVILFQAAVDVLSGDYRVLVFKNGQELVEGLSMQDQKPDLIFVDINMPVMNGVEALVQIRGHISKQLPVFLLSTANDRLNVELARKSGATGYLSKPDFTGELTEMLESVFSINWEQRSPDDFYVHLRFFDKAAASCN